MRNGQAEHVGVVLDAGEIVPTARFHGALHALVGQWMAMHAFGQQREARMLPFRGVAQGIAIMAMNSVQWEYENDMGQAYTRFTEALHTLINMPNLIRPNN